MNYIWLNPLWGFTCPLRAHICPPFSVQTLFSLRRQTAGSLDVTRLIQTFTENSFTWCVISNLFYHFTSVSVLLDTCKSNEETSPLWHFFRNCCGNCLISLLRMFSILIFILSFVQVMIYTWTTPITIEVLCATCVPYSLIRLFSTDSIQAFRRVAIHYCLFTLGWTIQHILNSVQYFACCSARPSQQRLVAHIARILRRHEIPLLGMRMYAKFLCEI